MSVNLTLNFARYMSGPSWLLNGSVCHTCCRLLEADNQRQTCWLRSFISSEDESIVKGQEKRNNKSRWHTTGGYLIRPSHSLISLYLSNNTDKRATLCVTHTPKRKPTRNKKRMRWHLREPFSLHLLISLTSHRRRRHRSRPTPPAPPAPPPYPSKPPLSLIEIKA